jgi:hypothetical protein
MSLYDLPNATSGADDIIIQVVDVVPSFTPLLLAFVYFIIFLGGIGKQKARTGTSDYAMWSTVAGIGTFLVALMLSTVTGILSLDVLVITLSVTILCGVWLFFDRRQSEV